MRKHTFEIVDGEKVVKPDFYTDWNEFWDFYITSVENDLGSNRFRTIPNKKKSKFLSRPDYDFKVNILNPLIRKLGMVTDNIILRWNPNSTTFYSTWDVEKKKYVVGYPTFTKYMCYWEPAMKAAFRHEMGHILRGDCILGLPFGRVSNANKCMDIRINAQLDREGMRQVYKCLYFKDDSVPLLVPEEQFPKCGLPYNEERPFDVPTWNVISTYFKNAAANKPKSPKQPPGPEQEKPTLKVGDYVVVNSPASEHNDKPGKIVGVEGDDYIVEEISQEEFDMIMGMLENMPKMLSTNIILGEFRKDELIPLTPPDEDGGGEYGDDDDDEGGGGGDDDEEQETEDDGGEGEGSDDTDESIKEKEKILNDLKNAGIDGNPEQQETEDDDEYKGGDDTTDDTDEDEPKGGDDTDEEDEGEGKEGEDDDAEEKEGEDDDTEKPGEGGKSEREKMLDEKIKEQKLKNDITQSLNNFKAIKEKHGTLMTSSEKASINKTIEDLEKLM